MDDLELLLDYANHKSEAAFAALVSRHVDLVYSVSLRFLRDAQLAEETDRLAERTRRGICDLSRSYRCH